MYYTTMFHAEIKPHKRCKRMTVTSSAAGYYDGEYFNNPLETSWYCQWCWRQMKPPRRLSQRSGIGFKPPRSDQKNAPVDRSEDKA